MADGSFQPACDVVRPWPAADERAFRNGMAKLASGVAIAACWADAAPRGLLVSSLVAVSVTPPRVLFCVNKDASAHAAMIGADSVSLSILADDDVEEARRFSTPELSHQRFRAADWFLEPDAAPTLRKALCAVSGQVRCRLDGGSHTVFILDIGDSRSIDGAPLLYFERAFRRVAEAGIG